MLWWWLRRVHDDGRGTEAYGRGHSSLAWPGHSVLEVQALGHWNRGEQQHVRLQADVLAGLVVREPSLVHAVEPVVHAFHEDEEVPMQCPTRGLNKLT